MSTREEQAAEMDRLLKQEQRIARWLLVVIVLVSALCLLDTIRAWIVLNGWHL